MSEADRRKWDERYREPPSAPAAVCEYLICMADALPTSGRALDVGGGVGQNSMWLARRGLDVTLVDISALGLERAAAAATAAGVQLATARLDLDADPLPTGPWDLVLATYFLWRPLFNVVPDLLTPGGLLVCVHPTRKNLERNARPPLAYLLDDGEMPRLARGLEIVHYEENWSADGRHEARLLARRRSDHRIEASSNRAISPAPR